MRVATKVGNVAALMAAAALVLTGCTSSEPELTPLPTTEAPAEGSAPADGSVPTEPPLTVPAPKDEAESIDMATRAVQMYLDTEAEIYNEHPDDMSAVDLVATDKAAESTKAGMEQINAAGSRSGYFTFEPVDAQTKVSEDAESVPFGYVEFYGCMVPHDVTITNDSGTTDTLTTATPTYLLVKYEADKGGWYLRNSVSEPEGGPQC